MARVLPLLLTVIAAMTIAQAQQADEAALLERARALHRQVPLIDGHNDYPWAVRENVQSDLDKLDIAKAQPTIHTDIARLKLGGLGGQFWSVYTPSDYAGQKAVAATLEQIDIVHQMMRRYPETFELALTAADVERIFKSGRIASLIGMEGGHSIDSSLAALRMFHRLGARYMTLTHSKNTPWADSATDTPQHGGLTPFGEDVVREMNWLGMLVDLSHVSPDTMKDAIRVSEAPVIFSHSSARAVNDVPRNVPDDVLRLLPKNGGIVMVTFVPGFLSPQVTAWGAAQTAETARLQQQFPNDEAARKAGLEAWLKANPAPRATIKDAADHIDHIRKVAGIDHVGLGGDYDGITSVPDGLEDVSKYPALTAELLRRGYSDDDVKKVLGLNALRVMRAAESTAARLQKQRGPSAVLFQETRVMNEPVTIVAMGDSTTAGTPGWKSRIEAPPAGAGDETSQYRVLADAGAAGLDGDQPGGERRTQRSDPRALRARRSRAPAPRCRTHRRGERRLPGADSAARHRQPPGHVRRRPGEGDPGGRGLDHSVQHRDAGPERPDARNQRVDPGNGRGGSVDHVRGHQSRRGGVQRQ